MAGIRQLKTAAEVSQADYSVAQILNMTGGFEKLASEKLPEFIKQQRDYESFGRKILLTCEVTKDDLQKIDGEDFFYVEKDLNSHAMFYGDDPQIPRYQIEGTGVNIGFTTISSDNITISKKRLLTQRYNYLERVQQLSAQTMVMLEDSRILELTEMLLKGNGTAVAPANAGQIVTTADVELKKPHMVALRKKLSQHDVPDGHFVMNPSTQMDMLSWAQEEVDQLTQREMLETGVKYAIWGVPIVTSILINLNNVYLYAQQDMVGLMPILQDLTVELTDTPDKLEKGLFMYEFVGFYLASHKAVAKLILNFKAGDPQVNESVRLEIEARLPKVNGLGSREETN